MGMLKEAWDEYGHAIKFEDLIDYKIRPDHCYIVVAWRQEDGMIDMADLARPSRSSDWDMQNDGHSTPISDKDWNKLHIVPHCDWFVIPGNENYRGLA